MQRLFISLLLVLAGTAGASAATREADWKKVDEAIEKGLPQTAIELLDPIQQAALRDQAYGEATKALARRIVMEGQIQGNKPEEKIRRLETALETVPAPMVPLLETLRAYWYWQYFGANRWRIMQRTASAEAVSDDFETWDLARLFAHIDDAYQRALSGRSELRQIPIAQFADFLVAGSVSDEYRPTLYDFIAHEALDFYTSGEQAGAQPEDLFEVEATSPLLGTTEEFLAWVPDTPQTNSPILKAIRLYQELLEFHQGDENPLAYADVDLARLHFGYNVVVGDATLKITRYQERLEAFVERWADQEIMAMGLYYWGDRLKQADERVKAHALASRGRDLYPESVGGKLCKTIVAELESKSLWLQTEQVWDYQAPSEQIQVHYLNVEKLYFRAYAVSWEEALTHEYSDLIRRGGLGAIRHRVLGKETGELALEWSTALPPTSDFQERAFSVKAPSGLEPGFYRIVASEQASFGAQDNIVGDCNVWVSDLAMVVSSGSDGLEGLVLDADKGGPMSGATVRMWSYSLEDGRWTTTTNRTGVDGRFRLELDDSSQRRSDVILHASKGRTAVASEPTFANRLRRSTTEARESVLVFTGRRIYRPGQTVHYKGIAISLSDGEADYRVLGGRTLEIALFDANGKEVARHAHRSSDFGSFSGHFVIPGSGVTGAMSLQTLGIPGQVGFNVEEYKRPKFLVRLDPSRESVRLGELVTVSGNAVSYTGTAVGSAQVSYRVERQVRYPVWRTGYRGSPPDSVLRNVAHGEVVTDLDGTFQFDFSALPDRSIAEEADPRFVFQVTVAVTDGAGETRHADRTYQIGYRSMEIQVTADEWQVSGKPVDLDLRTRTLDEDPIPAEGSVRVFRLRQPDKVHRRSDFSHGMNPEEPELSDWRQWPLGELSVEQPFSTNEKGVGQVRIELTAGCYRVLVESRDRYGMRVEAEYPLQVLDLEADQFRTRIPSYFQAESWSVEPGGTFRALWGTGYETGQAYVVVEHRGEIQQAFWTEAGTTQSLIELPVEASMRGGFHLHLTFVRENRAYLESRKVHVPWTNKEFEVSWEHFTSKLQPNGEETWTAVIRSQSGTAQNQTAPALAEMVATLYDASLDQFAKQTWGSEIFTFYQDRSRVRNDFVNRILTIPGRSSYPDFPSEVVVSYRHWPPDLTARVLSRGMEMMRAGGDVATAMAAPTESMPNAAQPKGIALALGVKPLNPGSEPGTPLSLDKVSLRRNLNETAFFFPHLMSDTNGVVRLTFTMPEALTEWRFMGFAHDRELRSGYLEGTAVTSKDLMVQPNPPRFLREGDIVEFPVKVSNQSDREQRGRVRLQFTAALTGDAVDQALGNATPELDFAVPAGESRSYSWRIAVPNRMGVLLYRAVASTGSLSDGEEGFLPVLSRRVLVTESLPLWISGRSVKEFEFERLSQADSSDTLEHLKLVVQMTSNPAWYAVLSLPYLMEFPHECLEQTFNRYYANELAAFIARSDPKIRQVFDLWRRTDADALQSPLEKNRDLRSVLLEETPWLAEAATETEARHNLGVLFEENRLTDERRRILERLEQGQRQDGLWSWFPGGPASRYISLYIVTGFGRLRHLGVDVNVGLAERALGALDAWISESYERIQRDDRLEQDNLTSTVALYLYGRSFFLKDRPIAEPDRKAVDYFLKQAREHWGEIGSRQSQGHLALALKRFGDETTPKAIMDSIREHAVHDEEMGMFWRDTERSWFWAQAPIETQALMIEAFAEVVGDAEAVEACKVWLLKQKQTQGWQTTKATADAVYALLLRGDDLLSSSELVEVELGGQDITPRSSQEVEAGTGFYEKRFGREEINSGMASITVRKSDDGVAWGGVHWQYLDDVSNVTAYEGTPLQLKKQIFKRVNSSSGPVLRSLTEGVHVGDELVVRVEVRVDRDMEYMHLKDQRGSGTEPVNVLSGYRYQDGLTYYESTRDTASHFFIEYLPKGVYVFEYPVRVQLRGEYQSGLAEVQCMYAPEFNSHSESVRLVVVE